MLLDPVDLFNGYVVNNRIAFIANSVVTVVEADPHRVCFHVCYLSGTVLRMSPFSNVSVTSGISVLAANLPLRYCLQLDGALTSIRWFGISDMGGANVLISEVFFDPAKVRL